MKKILTIAALSAILVTGCSFNSGKGIISVNGHKITKAEFDKAIDSEINGSMFKAFGGAGNFVKSDDNVMYLIFKEKVPFVKYSLVVLVGTWALFAFSHPDSYIAEYNLSRNTGEVYVVSKLSNDAVPVMIRYEEDLRNQGNTAGYMQGVYNRVYNLQFEKDVRKFNLSDYLALEAYRKSAFVTVHE